MKRCLLRGAVLMVVLFGPAFAQMPAGSLDGHRLSGGKVARLLERIREHPAAQLASRVLADAGQSPLWHRAVGVQKEGRVIVVVPVSGVDALLFGVRDGKVATAMLNHVYADRIPVCHHPAGRPGSAQTLLVGRPAIRVHLEQHGDTLGACEDDPDHRSGIEAAYVDLLAGVVIRYEIKSGGEIDATDSGFWQGPETLARMTTPVPIVPELDGAFRRKYPDLVPVMPEPPPPDTTSPLQDVM